MLQESAAGAVEESFDHATRGVLANWIDPAPVRMSWRCVTELVSAQAAANPRALAVAQGTASLSYAELERRSNQFARHLLSLGHKRIAFNLGETPPAHFSVSGSTA